MPTAGTNLPPTDALTQGFNKLRGYKIYLAVTIHVYSLKNNMSQLFCDIYRFQQLKFIGNSNFEPVLEGRLLLRCRVHCALGKVLKWMGKVKIYPATFKT